MTPTTTEWVSGAGQIAEQDKFGASGPADGLLFGDANNDGQVTGADLISVQQNFGNVLGPAPGSVPEPAMPAMLLSAIVLSMRRR